MRSIAKHAGVSVMTVSYILRGQTNLFRPETCTKVQQAIAALGYIPSGAPRAMRTGRFGSIAFVSATSSSQDYTWVSRVLLNGILDAATASELDLLYTKICAESAAATKSKLLREVNVDGLILNAVAHLSAATPDQLAQRYPLVWVNQKADFDAVYPDETASGRIAADRLVARGSLRPAFVQFWPDEGHYSFADRRKGFVARCAQVSHPVRVLAPQPQPWDIQAAVRDFILRERPDGICCCGEFEVATVFTVLAQTGLQAELVTFHDEIQRVGVQPIPTVIIPLAEVGRRAVGMLQSLILNRQPQPSIVVNPLPTAQCA